MWWVTSHSEVIRYTRVQEIVEQSTLHGVQSEHTSTGVMGKFGNDQSMVRKTRRLSIPYDTCRIYS